MFHFLLIYSSIDCICRLVLKYALWGTLLEPVWVAAVAFWKAFDSVEQDTMWSSLETLEVPNVNMEILKRLYIVINAGGS